MIIGEIMVYYYAWLDAYDFVTGIGEFDEQVTDDPYLVAIDSNDQTLVGKWYNRSTSTFMDRGYGFMEPVKTVDGAGSGLDADTLDGKHASEFALANHVHEGMSVGEHDHDDEYAPINHTHSEYASVSHEHDGYADDDDNDPLFRRFP